MTERQRKEKRGEQRGGERTGGNTLHEKKKRHRESFQEGQYSNYKSSRKRLPVNIK